MGFSFTSLLHATQRARDTTATPMRAATGCAAALPAMQRALPCTARLPHPKQHCMPHAAFVALEQCCATLLFSTLRHTLARAARTADAHILHALRTRFIACESPAATDGALHVALPASAAITNQSETRIRGM